MSERDCQVLLPVDGSAHSLRAVGFLIRLYPKLAPLKVHLLHVQLPSIVSVDKVTVHESVQSSTDLTPEEAVKPAMMMLDRAGVPYKSEVRSGYVGLSVVAYANDNHCDGIIMGTRGMGTTDQLLGSIARQVLHLSDVPVTLVK